MGVEKAGWQGIPAVQSADNANYSLLTAMKYNLERIIALLDSAGQSGSGTNNMLLQSLTDVNSELDGLTAAIRVEQQARIEGDEALAQQITQIIATGDGSNSNYLQSEPPTQPPYTLIIGDLWFDSDDNFKLHRWSGSDWAPVDDQRILANTAAISNEQSARIDADSALASQITALTSVVNSGDSTLQASILQEAQTRATADTALGTRIDTLTATVTTNNNTVTARISQEETVRASADAAATTRMNTMQSTIDGNTTSIANVDAKITTEATTRANADAALSSQVTTLTASVNKNTGDIASTNSALTTEQTVRANADTALGTQISDLSSTVTGQGTSLTTLTARVATEEQTRAAADSALSTRVDTVSATVTNQQTQINQTNAAIVTEQTARANADTALAQNIQTVSATVAGQQNQINQTNASVVAEQQARASADTALAQNIQTVSTTVDGHTAAITQNAQSINGINAKYSLVVDANGVITGIQLISGAGQSQFIVNAEDFRIENSAGVPFEVIGGTTYLKNVVIQDDAITTARLMDNATFDFDYAYVDYGAYTTVPSGTPVWAPVSFPGGAMRIVVTAASGTTQVVNLTTTLHMIGIDTQSSGNMSVAFRVVRTNDNKVLQTFQLTGTPTAISNVALEFFDAAPIANTPLTYELQYIPSAHGRIYWYAASLKGIVYKR